MASNTIQLLFSFPNSIYIVGSSLLYSTVSRRSLNTGFLFEKPKSFHLSGWTKTGNKMNVKVREKSLNVNNSQNYKLSCILLFCEYYDQFTFIYTHIIFTLSRHYSGNSVNIMRSVPGLMLKLLNYSSIVYILV